MDFAPVFSYIVLCSRSLPIVINKFNSKVISIKKQNELQLTKVRFISFWRRGRDSNPRQGISLNTISSRAPQTSSAISPCRLEYYSTTKCICQAFFCIFLFFCFINFFIPNRLIFFFFCGIIDMLNKSNMIRMVWFLFIGIIIPFFHILNIEFGKNANSKVQDVGNYFYSDLIC